MQDNSITLPWPPAVLNPNNNRGHWGKRLGPARKYRLDCSYLARGCVVPSSGQIHLQITFHPPDARKRDLDNMLSAAKNGLDGLADAWKIDDNRFMLTIKRGEKVKHGAIIVEVLTPPPE